MRAPLRAMQGYSQMLQAQEVNLSSRARDFLRRIMESSQRMDLLITDALSYARIVREELHLEPVDPEKLLNEMLESYPELQPHRAEVQIQGPIPAVQGNRAALTQCFSNLLGNAIKFVQPGQKPVVRVWAETVRNFLRIWFEENGIGIAPDQHEKIFKMFQRVSADYEGTGIGLTLVRKVVERMKGRVGVESTLGQGSRFWVELPMKEVPASTTSSFAA
jgi:signal transduction histidine kinase